MTFPPPQEAGNQAVPEGGAEEGGRRLPFQVSPTRENPISQSAVSTWITADARKEPPTEKPAGEENPAVRPRPTGRKNPQKERRCATLLFRRRRGV
jgi:hypothetical protein